MLHISTVGKSTIDAFHPINHFVFEPVAPSKLITVILVNWLSTAVDPTAGDNHLVFELAVRSLSAAFKKGAA